jgi:protease I
MKKSIPLILGIIVIAGIVGYYLYSQSQKEEASDQSEGKTEDTGKEDQVAEPEEVPTSAVEDTNVLLVIAPSNYHDNEYSGTRSILENAGYEVTVASKGVTTATGMLGGSVNVNIDLSQVYISDFIAIVFIGGTGNHIYFDDGTAIGLAKEFYEEGKVVAAICSAPTILANANILEGKRATCDAGYKSNLTSKGATYTGEAVTVDGLIVTGNGPSAATAFGEKIVETIKAK